jgi:hypothetical protein
MRVKLIYPTKLIYLEHADEINLFGARWRNKFIWRTLTKLIYLAHADELILANADEINLFGARWRN